MKRNAKMAFIGCLLFLSACVPQGAPVLPADEVLQRAADAVQNLASASFTASARLENLLPNAGEVTVESTGRLQDGGKQLQFTANATMEESRAGVPASVIAMEVIVAGENEVYLRLNELKGDTPALLFGAGVPPMEVWWRLPSEGPGASAVPASPDPALLRAQAKVVRIERDRGIATVDGRRVYRFDTVVDKEKLQAYLEEVSRAQNKTFDAEAFEKSWGAIDIHGTLWIDAETFFVQRLEWAFASADGKGLSGELRVTMSDHNAAEPIVPPQNAEPFPWSTAAPAAPLMLP